MKLNINTRSIFSGIFTLFSVSIFLLVPLKQAYAAAPNPAWWIDNLNSFSQYDDYQYKNGRTHQGTFYSGNAIDSYILSASASYDGVSAVGPRPFADSVSDVSTFFTADSGSSQELEWECAELVKRFLYLEYGAPSLGGTNGNQVVDNYVNTYPNLFQKITNNGVAQVYPKPGDILSYGSSSPGHTAIVQSVTNQSSGSATVQVIEQNASSTGISTQTFTSWTFQNGVDNNPSDPNTVTAWLHPIVSKSNTWTNSSGSLPNTVVYDTSTLLTNGKVLVAGGERSGNPVSSAYLYDPSAKTWSTTGSLSTGRRYHTANLITISGGSTRVLVAGGGTTSGLTSSTELFNPSAGTWSSGASMSTARALHTSTTLSDGTVLTVGGQNSGGSGLTSVELYDPVGNTWTTKTSLTKGRWNHTATLLNDGRVLIAGGVTSPSGSATSSAEIYTPSTNSWTSFLMTVPRAGHTATLLPNGKVLLAGGISTGGSRTQTTETFDPSSNTSSSSATMNYDHGFSYSGTASVITFHDGTTKRVLKAGGLCTSSGINTELYDYTNNAWTNVTNMNQPRCYATETVLNDGTVLESGSGTFTGAGTNTSEFYTP